ncbi:MAG: oxidoreductase [Bacteroidales bacterium]|nr:oxidoreductase [Bacteroidales bacterium]
MTVIAPGHFHASLIQKDLLPGVSDTVRVFAPAGVELDSYLETVKSFGQRAEHPVQWVEDVYSGPDYLEKLPAARPGDFVVLAGNNRLKTRYILEAVRKGYNVLADKPMAISGDDYAVLEEAYASAGAKGLVIMELMTERFELLNRIAAALSADKAFFGEWKSVRMSSTHHFYKEVAGNPLRRPAWFYDISQQGEGIADVSTHLIDQVFNAVSPGVPVASGDVVLTGASHWPTVMTGDMFRASTGEQPFPGFLSRYVEGDKLSVLSNGKIVFSVKGVPCEVEVLWNYQAPPGTGDTSWCLFEGSCATISIVQDASTGFVRRMILAAKEEAVRDALGRLKGEFPFLETERIDDGHFQILFPQEKFVGHEECFNLVARTFLTYLDGKPMPAEETINALSKYKLTIGATKLASGK